MSDDAWSNLLPEILILILHKFEHLNDYGRFGCVCKSWSDAVRGPEMLCWPRCRFPFLLLAEGVAPGSLINDCELHSDKDDQDYYVDSDEDDQDSDVDSEQEEDSDGVQGVEEDNDDNEQGDSDDDEDNNVSEEEDTDHNEDSDDSEVEGDDGGNVRLVAGVKEDYYNYLNNTIGSSRGLYSLLTGKTYVIDLPEAAGRLILGTNKGWLVTLGRDLQLNLLHPLLRRQIPLPPMLSFPRQFDYYENYPPEEAYDLFIWKVAMSFKILDKNMAFSFYHPRASPSAIVMAIYGECRYLGFARLGDKVWTDVNVPLTRFNLPSRGFEDIAYHKGNFYAVDNDGGIFVCGSDNNEEWGDIKARQIAIIENQGGLQKYLVESSSGSDLWLLVRNHKTEYDKAKGNWPKYRTTDFSVWRLDLKYSDSLEDISCTLEEEKYLGNEAIFVGNTSSTGVLSSEIIKPNCIYFTDDKKESYYHRGGGHDMGIFNMEHRTIEPHFQGKSIHPISPPLWYF